MLKINTIVFFVLIITVLVFPLAGLPDAEKENSLPTVASVSEKTESNGSVPAAEEKQKKAEQSGETVRVYNPDTDKTETMDMYEYIYGVVCAECPMLYHEEAIKAQIVAAHTYTLHCKRANSAQEYDLTTKPETSQAYITREQAMKNWGSNGEKYDKRLRELMDEVWGEALYHKNEPILAAYHAISSGKTETAEKVWGKAIPYLVSVESEGDKLADKYETTAEFSVSEAENILKPLGITVKKLKSAKAETTDCGTVLRLNCGNTAVTGEQIRAAFNLRSGNFKIKVTSKKVTFTVLGYGHGLGMSQNGANFLAKSGFTYREILEHYYSGAELKRAE